MALLGGNALCGGSLETALQSRCWQSRAPSMCGRRIPGAPPWSPEEQASTPI